MIRFFGGSRIFKTGIAVLVTALVCELLGWPSVFAVITAIVTIEPTVSDSIKKGLVRFPASAIGSAYAVIFISLFGNSPITYALAAMLTIATCFKLNLHAGLLVATLTSVAMIEVVHEHFFISFIIRLGTTTIGLVVSTVVNMFILPPNYREDITTNIEKITKHTSSLLNKIYTNLIDRKTDSQQELNASLEKLGKQIKKTDQLIEFQKSEFKYHPFVASDKALFQRLEKQAKLLQRIHDELDHIIYLPIQDLKYTEEEKETIRIAIQQLSKSLQIESNFSSRNHHENRRNITGIFWKNGANIMKNSKAHQTMLPPELVILFELLTLYDLVEGFYANTEKNLDESSHLELRGIKGVKG